MAGYVSWRFTRFVIDADELRVDTGAIFRRSIRVAFDKVQSIDVVQPFAARLFGLAELQIDVGSHERSKLRYLSLGRAYALRDYLLARARGYQAEAATSTSSVSVLTDLHEADEVLVQVQPQTLLLAAVTSHEFWSIVLGGVLFVARRPRDRPVVGAARGRHPDHQRPVRVRQPPGHRPVQLHPLPP